MKYQSRIKQAMISTMILLVSAIVLCAQEAPPPPPPDAGDGKVFFFTRMEGGPGGRVVTGAPYSAQAVTETNQTLSDGNKIHEMMTTTVYRDSQGRTRREETMRGLGPWAAPAGESKPMVMIDDPVAGVHYTLDPTAHTAQKMPAIHGRPGAMEHQISGAAPSANVPIGVAPSAVGAGRAGFEKHLAAEGGTRQTESLGTQIIGGVQAEGTRTTVTIPAGGVGNTSPIQIVTERWYSSQLQTVLMSTRTDPRVGTTTYRLTNINQAEPAATLFQVPADYAVKDAPRMNHRMRTDQLPGPTPNQ
jgi:hypothetical protein